MAKNTYKSNTFKKPDKEKKSRPSGSGPNFSFFRDPRLKLAVGFFLIIAGLYMFFALLSYMFTGQADFSEVGTHQSLQSIFDSLQGKEISNWLGLYGAIISHFFIFRWFLPSARYPFSHSKRRFRSCRKSNRLRLRAALPSLRRFRRQMEMRQSNQINFSKAA